MGERKRKVTLDQYHPYWLQCVCVCENDWYPLRFTGPRGRREGDRNQWLALTESTQHNQL